MSFGDYLAHMCVRVYVLVCEHVMCGLGGLGGYMTPGLNFCPSPALKLSVST